MKVQIKISPPDILDAIQNAAGDLTEVSGVGSDGNSEYEVTGYDAEANPDGSFTVTFDLDRISGKFASKDEIADNLIHDFATEVEVTIEAETC